VVVNFPFSNPRPLIHATDFTLAFLHVESRL
jgi:hypothetical protein